MSDQVQKPDICEHPADCTCVLHRPSLERLNALMEFLLDHSYNVHKGWRETFEGRLQIEQRRKKKSDESPAKTPETAKEIKIIIECRHGWRKWETIFLGMTITGCCEIQRRDCEHCGVSELKRTDL